MSAERVGSFGFASYAFACAIDYYLLFCVCVHIKIIARRSCVQNARSES